MTDNLLKNNVKLYYLGGLAEPGKAVYVQSKGKSVQVPEIGGHLVLQMYYARDLISRGHNGVHSVWSLSERDAIAARAGTLHRDTSRLIDPGTLTVEQLQVLLADRLGPVEETPKEAFLEKMRQIAATDESGDESEQEAESEDLEFEDGPEPEEKSGEDVPTAPRKGPGRPRKTLPTEQKEEASE